ncbi:type II toxin-antitoxin system VapC family toxin [Brevundimonas staleyi]|uniref:Ribonuclease VapC n=1 Tax=Brevundimonas staleyi TaxID=74326 RepID=A0ABW0FMN1_9CAUL
MRLVDTSAWIEWLIDSPTAESLARTIPEAADWLVPTLVQFELAKWMTRERGEAATDRAVAFSRTCVVVPLTTHIALQAAEISATHKLATADAVIYATAQEYGADLLTCDAHFRDLPGVILVEKI